MLTLHVYLFDVTTTLMKKHAYVEILKVFVAECDKWHTRPYVFDIGAYKPF